MIERNQKVFKELPVSPLVKNCYLKKVEYKSDEKDGEKFEYMAISVNKGDRWLNERYYNPIKTRYETNREFQLARQRLRRCLEHIASTYFDTDGMRELLKNPGGSFKSYVELFKTMMEAINYKEIEIEVKTVTYRGKVRLSGSPFFIKRAGDARIEFFYSQLELDNLKKENDRDNIDNSLSS